MKSYSNPDRRILFPDSFRKDVTLGGNKDCRTKRHFSGILHEVVSYLDLLAAHHPESRFVYPSILDIQLHCKHFSTKHRFGKRSVEYAIQHLQMRHVVSPRLLRFCDGRLREGFIVAPHEHLTVRRGQTVCSFVGMAAPFDCWHQLPVAEKEGEEPDVFWVNPAAPNRHQQPERKEAK